jgi:acyl carrier protein
MHIACDSTEDVRQLIASVFGCDLRLIDDDACQATVAEWTSLNHIMLMAALEERFDTTLTMSEMLEMTGVREIVRVVAQRSIHA